tara:strand:- start:13376 stop:14212 length:837 start_codon:yes stop_codon:yes gene_type:complete
MIKDFANRLDYNIPSHLKRMVMGILTGETKEPISLSGQPMYATGFPLLVYSQGEVPHFRVNDTPLIPESNLNVAGQIGNIPITFSLKGIFGLTGIILHPTAAYYLFHKPGIHFLNTWESHEKASPIDSQPLYNNLSQTNEVNTRVALLLDFITELQKNQLPAIPWLDRALDKIFETGGIIEQSKIAEQAGVSLRHFRRVFKKVVGLSPKYYCKVIQLNTVFELLNTSNTEKLHHLALDCGYYDQSHFIRDFNNFIKTSPENFLNGKYSYLKTYLGRHT